MDSGKERPGRIRKKQVPPEERVFNKVEEAFRKIKAYWIAFIFKIVFLFVAPFLAWGIAHIDPPTSIGLFFALALLFVAATAASLCFLFFFYVSISEASSILEKHRCGDIDRFSEDISSIKDIVVIFAFLHIFCPPALIILWFIFVKKYRTFKKDWRNFFGKSKNPYDRASKQELL